MRHSNNSVALIGLRRLARCIFPYLTIHRAGEEGLYTFSNYLTFEGFRSSKTFDSVITKSFRTKFPINFDGGRLFVFDGAPFNRNLFMFDFVFKLYNVPKPRKIHVDFLVTLNSKVSRLFLVQFPQISQIKPKLASRICKCDPTHYNEEMRAHIFPEKSLLEK